ncbi:hypothetical protein AMAG_01140 [Allomyces macrogynus ATCC 38327]|uniref:U3 small nucleolar ribonucleoprotein protein IMP4 n=1 Tax=Allomyces macrogynus (strain ATCC 38327) TaxID=578462 RepID=A0A0L0RYT5_ALLM3|nr:hypothetical protein AMAG_01140 [Allomyces macrogynus ATCC 38327]|eukprot:KNE55226.1 hypothetical protein AMAG_01140 [Allomyces macrogynus ATCC 38327]
MQRRDARLRKEYLYKKAHEQQEQATFEKKQQVKAALEYGMIITHFPYGPTAYFTLHNVVLRHDIADKGTVSEAYPHLIFHNFNTKLGERAKNILKHLFPVPKEDSKRVMTFANTDDHISFRHHVYYPTGPKSAEIAEVGPRFEARLYEIRLGTVDMKDADVEWALRPYHRTARKRELL